jgi:hypothetical protein
LSAACRSSGAPSATATPTPRITLNEIKTLGRLETIEYVMQVVVDEEKEPDNLWTRIFGNDKIILIAKGEVVAGFDLSELSELDAWVQGDRVILTLPPPEIFYSRLDNEETLVYKRDTGFLVKADQYLEGTARLLAERRLLDWAEEHGILEKAEENGIIYFERLLGSLGFTDIKVLTKEVLLLYTSKQKIQIIPERKNTTTSWRASSRWGETTTGTPGLMIPAFSAAI